MFTRIPVLVFTIVLVVLAVVDLVSTQYLTVDARLPYRLVFVAWGILALARIVLEPLPDAQGASGRTTRIRIGEVTYWLTTAAAVIVAMMMVDYKTFIGAVEPTDIIALCLPALVFALGRGSRYILAGY